MATSGSGPSSQPDADTLLDRVSAYGRFAVALVITSAATVFFFCTSAMGVVLGARRGRRWMLKQPVWWAKAVLWSARCPLEVTFTSPLPEGGFLVFANHQSVLDIPAVFLAMGQTPVTFAVKRELFSAPFIGWYLHLAGFIQVDRRDREHSTASYQRAAERIRDEGLRVGIYPEGTRSIDGSVLPFKQGAFVLAIDSQSPIVPLAVEGAQLAIRKHTFRLRGHAIRIVVGAPISTVGMTHADRERLLVQTRTAILALHETLGAAPSPLEPMVAPPGKPSGAR